MTSDRWSEIDKVLQQALDKPPSERDRFVDSACAADIELACEVRSLLLRYQEDSGPLGAFTSSISFLNSLRRSPEIQPGTRVAKYEVVSRLGRGGMGDVYLARDVMLERNIALKILAPGFSDSPALAQPVFSEARAASALNHLNIVTVYDAGESDGHQFLAAEYVEGETLRERLNRGPIPLREALRIAIQIASALEAAHAARVIHRDIKPENVMLRRDGVVKVVDFGIAKIREVFSAYETGGSAYETDGSAYKTDGRDVVADRGNGTVGPGEAAAPPRRPVVIGSVPYMSPEQALGLDVDRASDVFSFGVLLFEVVSGARAFPGNSDSAVLRAVIHYPAELPPKPPLPRGLRTLIQNCLAKDARNRPADMTEIRQALERIEARLEHAHRNERVAIGAGAGLVVLAAILWFVWSRSTPNYVATRITHSGSFKDGAVALNGSDLYFDKVENWSRITVRLALDGDDETQLSIPNRGYGENNEIQDGAPGLNRLLMRSWDRGSYTAGEFWFLQLPQGTRVDVPQALGFSGAWSRDGSRIAYLSEERDSGGGPVEVLSVSGLDGKTTRICRLDDVPKRPSGAVTWTPDDRIWFLQRERLFEVDPVAGASPRPVFAADDAPQGPGRWTADGRSFVFSNLWTQDLWMLRGSARSPAPKLIRLTSGPFQFGTPAPSSNGRSIYAVGQMRRGQVVRFDRVRHAWLPLVEGLSADGLDFSRDGRSLVYVTYPEGEMWTSGVDGSSRSQITRAPMRAFIPRWSPDGKQIVFAGRTAGGRWHVYLASVPGHSVSRLVPGDGTEATPSWSPDGSKIAYAPFAWDVGPQERKIWIYDLASRRATPLPGSEGLFSPAWSPDGHYLAALRFDRYGMNPVAVYDLESHQVKDMGSIGVYLSWSPDSRSIYMLRKTPVNPALVLRLSLNGDPVEPVARFQERIAANSPVPAGDSMWLGFTPQQDPILLQDLGNREVYELRAR